MNAGTRFRLVTVQGGKEHVSTVVLGEAEAVEAIDLEESMHKAAGWAVRRSGSSLLCVRGLIVRRLFVRGYDPMSDWKMRQEDPQPLPLLLPQHPGGE